MDLIDLLRPILQIVPEYVWQELPRGGRDSCWIRVLTLEPGKQYDVLRGTLKFTCLNGDSAHDPYDAISYHWGTPGLRTRLYLDHGYTMVERNLAAALRYLRSPDHSRNLWADAICIDQNNLVEKADQVSKMNRIFEGANVVISWLGPPSGMTTDAYEPFTLLRNIASKADDIDALKANHGIYWRYALEMSLKDFQLLLQFFCNTYFERIWVVQEVIMARQATLQCGYDFMTWDELDTALNVLSKVYLPSGFPIHPNVATTLLILRFSAAEDGRHNLSQLLHHFSIRMAQEPADKLFALIGLLPSAVRARMSELEPDYSKNVAELYMNAVCCCLQEDKSLDILSTCQPQNRSLVGLPSWTPDWSFNYRESGPTENVPKVNIFRYASNFTASSQSSVSFRRDGMFLTLQGYILDKIRVLGDPSTASQQRQFAHANTMFQVFNNPPTYSLMWLAFKERALQSQLEAKWRIFFDKFKKPNKPSHAAAAPEESYWLTVTALDSQRLGKTLRLVADESHVERAYASHKRLTLPLRLAVRLHFSLSILILLEYLLTIVRYYLQQLGWSQYTSQDFPLHTHCRCMGWTEHGRFANLPEHCDVGDVIVLAKGGKVPLVLRPRGSGLFEVVGDAYVYGVMFGEAWNEAKCGDLVLL